MRIAITGASGLVGSALMPVLERAGHEVVRLVRWLELAEEPDAVYWRPSEGKVDAEGLEGCDAVIHLAAENIAGVWTSAKKRKIRESRVRGTELLSRTLAGLERPPRVLLSASAIGYYGDRGPDEVLTEDAPPGGGFMGETAVLWERATAPASEAGIRVVRMRFGLILARNGGMLGTMLPAFKVGLGGAIGSGRQVWSWIAIDDVISGIGYALRHDGLSGAANFTAPNPVTNDEFTRTLGRVLGRPTFLRLPGFAARMLPGGMGTEMLLSGARVVPEELREAGYEFAYPELEPALQHVLGVGGPFARRA